MEEKEKYCLFIYKKTFYLNIYLSKLNNVNEL